MSESWAEWKRTVLEPLLEWGPGQPRSPNLQALLARDPATVDLALLAADTDRTQDYVFESSKLPFIRGASALLTQLNSELATRLGRAIVPECVIYFGGGGLLALVPESVAKDLMRKLERMHVEETGWATITCVTQPVSPSEVVHGFGGSSLTIERVNALHDRIRNADWQRVASAYVGSIAGHSTTRINQAAFDQVRGFGSLVRTMGTRLRRAKELPLPRPHVEAIPYAMRCQACQVRPAQRVYTYLGENWPLCWVCRSKLNLPEGSGQNATAKSAQVDEWVDWSRQDAPQDLSDDYWRGIEPSTVKYAQDLNDLGMVCQKEMGSRYVAWIYADGNRMGRVLQALPSPKAYGAFSRGLQRALRNALYRALLEKLLPAKVERSQGQSGSQEPKQAWIHPFEPLVIGGDDLVAIVPGNQGLDVAVRLCQLFEDECAKHIPIWVRNALPPRMRLQTLSVGVIIADSHNPVRVLQRLAKELCHNAKRRAQHESDAGRPQSALDFFLLKSQSMVRRHIHQVRAMPPLQYEEAGHKGARALTAAPYTVEEAVRLLELLAKMEREHMASSQLHGLVEALHQGRYWGQLHYLYQMARETRHSAEIQEARPGFLYDMLERWPVQGSKEHLPWHRVPGGGDREFASALPDLLELYPLYRRPTAEP